MSTSTLSSMWACLRIPSRAKRTYVLFQGDAPLYLGRNPSWCVIIILWSYYHIITRSLDHDTKWWKSFLVPRHGVGHVLSRLPLRQGTLPKNKRTTGNNFWRRICQWLSNHRSSPKTPINWLYAKFVLEKHRQTFFRRRKMKRCKSSETCFPKVSRRSEPSSRGKRPFEIFASSNFGPNAMGQHPEKWFLNVPRLTNVIDAEFWDTLTSTSTIDIDVDVDVDDVDVEGWGT